MNLEPSSQPHLKKTDEVDTTRVNYWLNYLSTISEDNVEESDQIPAKDSREIDDAVSEKAMLNTSGTLSGLEEVLLGDSASRSSSPNDFDLLQEILVKPEMVEFRERITTLEKKVEKLGNRQDAEDFAKLIVPLISKLLNYKLAKLKKEIVAEIAPLIERLIEEQSAQDKSLSIRVVGIPRDVN